MSTALQLAVLQRPTPSTLKYLRSTPYCTTPELRGNQAKRVTGEIAHVERDYPTAAAALHAALRINPRCGKCATRLALVQRDSEAL